MDVQAVLAALRGRRFNLVTETRMQDDMEKVLIESRFDFGREVRLSPADRIDFLVGDVGIECKGRSARDKMAVYRQLVRYAKHERIAALILATNRSMGLPETIEGKPVYYLSLGEAWI